MSMKTEKKTARIEFRETPEQVDAFAQACKNAGLHASDVIRDLCKAATPYMQTNCTDGRWRPPVLITERQAALLDAKAEIVQIHNGKGHQVARTRKGGRK